MKKVKVKRKRKVSLSKKQRQKIKKQVVDTIVETYKEQTRFLIDNKSLILN